MHAVTVWQKCLPSVFTHMHAARTRVLLGAVAALLIGRRLIPMDLARSWPGASRVRAPLKRLDRLLGNRHLAQEREGLYAAMTRWLVRHPRPVIVIDWSDLKADRSLHLLRAGVPIGARTLTVLEAIYPTQNSPRRRAGVLVSAPGAGAEGGDTDPRDRCRFSGTVVSGRETTRVGLSRAWAWAHARALSTQWRMDRLAQALPRRPAATPPVGPRPRSCKPPPGRVCWCATAAGLRGE